METLKLLLQEHYDNHPVMEVGDAVKFLYQSCMGGGHLIADEEASLTRLEAEWAAVEGESSAPLYETLGNGLYRLNLNVCKGIGLSTKTVNRLFCLTAQEATPDRERLEAALSLVYALPFPREAVDEYLGRYRKQGCPMASHSAVYRAHYSPAYRIVSKYYVNLIPLLSAIDGQLDRGNPVRLAIDGPCATGKSTLGAALARIYRCPLIHMDDFFLRPEQRTPERLARPGENVDHERFSAEVFSPLLAGKAARYRPWRCQEGTFGPEVTVEPGPLTVVEGCYSLRPDLRESYSLRVWLDAPWTVRRQRLLERCGPEGLARFEALWIPLEDRYFEACRVKECCHILLSGDNS